MTNRYRIAAFWCVAVAGISAGAVQGANQTDSLTPIALGGNGRYRIVVREYNFGAAQLPGLHSYAAGTAGDKWVLLSGRTNGVHDLDQAGEGSFPPVSQNRDVWVIDPVSKQSWHRSLGSPALGQTDAASGLSESQILSLAATNNQFEQVGDRLYISGGYGLNEAGQFETFNKFSAIDLPGLANWVMTGAGQAANHIRQIDSQTASVTGGAMYAMNGKMHIVFGQDFDGPYSPRSDGDYTRQVRSFTVVDDGLNLSLANVSETAPDGVYRRRDLNVAPILQPDGLGGTVESLVAFSGVFTTDFGAWTVPVVVDDDGLPSMADPAAPSAFKQGFNNYHSAKLGLYSSTAGVMDEVLFGGISLQTLDPQTGQIVTDEELPFVNDVTAVSISASSQFTQHHLGYFPEIDDALGAPWRFGANAEFFLAGGVPAFANEVINADLLAGPTVLGYIFGGIMTNGPHTRGRPEVTSTASQRIFEVVYVPVPEPSAATLAGVAVLAWLFRSTNRVEIG